MQEEGDRNALIREEVRDLSKAINQVYNSIVMTCQRKCISDFTQRVLSKEETTCLIRCADTHMYLDNYTYEMDTASQIAATEGKMKKASFYMNRRLEDVTQASPNQ